MEQERQREAGRKKRGSQRAAEWRGGESGCKRVERSDVWGRGERWSTERGGGRDKAASLWEKEEAGKRERWRVVLCLSGGICSNSGSLFSLRGFFLSCESNKQGVTSRRWKSGKEQKRPAILTSIFWPPLPPYWLQMNSEAEMCRCATSNRRGRVKESNAFFCEWDKASVNVFFVSLYRAKVLTSLPAAPVPVCYLTRSLSFIFPSKIKCNGFTVHILR